MSGNTPPLKPEITKLLTLAHDKSPSGKNKLFDDITDIFENNHQSLSTDERYLMSQILEQLLLNVETLVRQRLASRLATMRNVPAELIILLANDQIDVARPILDLSELLQDEDLIKIVLHRSLQHQLSIAGRKNIGSNVCRQLIATGNDDVVIKMLTNNDAKIDDVTLEKLVKQSRTRTKYQAPIIRRPELPPALAARMYSWVSKNLKETLLEVHSLNKNDIYSSLSEATMSLQKEDYVNAKIKSNEENLIDKLHKAGKLQPSFLMKSLNQGQVLLFELAFAKLVNISHEKIRHIIYDRGETSLAVACCAVNIDRSVFLTIYRLTRIARKLNPELPKEKIDVVFDLFEHLDARRAELRIHKWLADEARVPLF
jgi:uncharacterized protein (DUF2336 family)